MAGKIKRFLVLCPGGLEDYATEHILQGLAPARANVEVLPSDMGVYDPSKTNIGAAPGKSGVGKLIVETEASVAAVKGLRAAQTVYAYITHVSNLSPEQPEGINQIQQALRAHKDAWEASIATWKASLSENSNASKESEDMTSSDTSSLTFRCSCFRNGRHKYNSTDVAGGLGKVVLEWEKWSVNLLEFDVEVVAFILQSSVTLALALNSSRTRRRNVRLPKPIPGLQGAPQTFSEGMTAVLRPCTAFLLTRFAKVKSGDILCDCMAGVGSIPLAAVLDDHSVTALGGDIEEVNAKHAELNAQRSLTDRGGVAESLQWDAMQLPLRDNCVDCMVVDMPFGMRCGNARINHQLYPKALAEMWRVTRSGARVVLLGTQKNLLLRCIAKQPWTIEESRVVNIGGAQVFLIRLLHG